MIFASPFAHLKAKGYKYKMAQALPPQCAFWGMSFAQLRTVSPRDVAVVSRGGSVPLTGGLVHHLSLPTSLPARLYFSHSGLCLRSALPNQEKRCFQTKSCGFPFFTFSPSPSPRSSLTVLFQALTFWLLCSLDYAASTAFPP